MKKYTQYILIIIVLCSFGIISTVYAQQNNTLGVCNIPAINGSQPNKIYNLTPENCTQKKGTWEKDTEPRGTCIINNTVKSNWTASACAASNGKWSSDYYYLAPLPNPNNNGALLTSFNPADPQAFSKYLNLIIKTIIGLSAVMAVVMIVIGGMEYMTSELISEKSAGREKINGAVFGLVLALCSYLLLYTINPNLLNSDVKVSDVTVDIQVDLDKTIPVATVFDGVLPTGKVAACASGVVKSSTTHIVACSSISQSIDQMMADAKKANFEMFAGGFRTSEQQKQLRIKNCNGDFTSINASCTPPTALPGHSDHESGLAFDIACKENTEAKGQTISSTNSPCFTWLSNNASKYGLQNLVGGQEPWHWSTDGH